MLTKILINKEAYEVDLLDSHEVIAQIKSDFMSGDVASDEIISQYIDNYEKVEYKEKAYFILKSRVPIEFKQKTYTKKYICGDEMARRFFTGLIFPIAYTTANIFSALNNIKNKIKSSFGTTKINGNLLASEGIFYALFLAGISVAFWFAIVNQINSNHLPFWVVFIFQAVNVLLAMLKPFKYHYNQIENYKLAPYTFDSKYEDISSDPITRLQAMKTTQDKRKMDFDFSEDNKTKEEKEYATY